MDKRSQPVWHIPKAADSPKLKVYNSLTRKKEYFVPQFGNKVLWYSCGPTVYDAAHMGHARSYISFDILRRILSDYFSYDVFYVMNITDIDDKIIKRARQNYLYEEYVKNSTDTSTVVSDVKEFLQHTEAKMAKIEDPDKKNMVMKSIENTRLVLQEAEQSLSSSTNNEILEKALKNLLTGAQDILKEELDNAHGNEVTDNSIFSSLPAKWEEEFFKDMESLNVLPPDAVTRVSEYIPEILNYVEGIMKSGYAYVSNGSVYFDTMEFDQTPHHFYAKLVPEAFGDLKQLHEGEGDLSVSEDRLLEKKHPSDFAIWKASKPGEPSWDSPWGKGRPGWHIECSVMASDLLGSSLDIHTGGCDLKFPHHDNELAQAEAYYANDHWVRYFLHSGHLTISGCKMSKSLKNFITIREALQKNTARQLRFAFLLHSWKDTLDYSQKTLDMAIHYERSVMEFFLNVKDAIRGLPNSGRTAFVKWGKGEMTLNERLQEKQAAVHNALCDNIDTRTALDSIRELITSTNVYMSNKKNEMSPCNRLLLTNVMSYVHKILKIFGVLDGDSTFGFSQTTSKINVENMVMPYLSSLATFRENVRQAAREVKATQILKLCDQLRDDVLPELGVRLEDREGLPAIKLVDKEELIRERNQKLKLEEEKRLEKERLHLLKVQQEEQKKIPPSEMFKLQTDKYSQFNEDGIPTHDAEGKELSKGQIKKIMKQYETQKKKYEDYKKNGLSIEQKTNECAMVVT